MYVCMLYVSGVLMLLPLLVCLAAEGDIDIFYKNGDGGDGIEYDVVYQYCNFS
jgi:hypothetical protein